MNVLFKFYGPSARVPTANPKRLVKNCESGDAFIQCPIFGGHGVVPRFDGTDREVERGQEIQEGKARCPGAQEEGDKEGEAGQEGKG
jgi:hypothetical protein